MRDETRNVNEGKSIGVRGPRNEEFPPLQHKLLSSSSSSSLSSSSTSNNNAGFHTMDPTAPEMSIEEVEVRATDSGDDVESLLRDEADGTDVSVTVSIQRATTAMIMNTNTATDTATALLSESATGADDVVTGPTDSASKNGRKTNNGGMEDCSLSHCGLLKAQVRLRYLFDSVTMITFQVSFTTTMLSQPIPK